MKRVYRFSISEHAQKRYCERILDGIELSRPKIADLIPECVQSAIACGATCVTHEGIVYVAAQGRLKTVFPGNYSRLRSVGHWTKKLSTPEYA